MMTAVVLHLRPVAEARLPLSHGSFAHAAALQLFLRLDPQLSHRLHGEEGHKPFTCSPLGGTDRRDGFDLILSPSQLYSWRLTGLTSEVSQLLQRVSPQIGGINMQDAVFSIDQVSTAREQHPEAGRETYENLLLRWARAEPPLKMTLYFHTPTTFRVGDFLQPFPLPHLVFGSLLSAWNTFAPHPLMNLQDSLLETLSVGNPDEKLSSDTPDALIKKLLEETVVLSNWRGETRLMKRGGHEAVGFVGKFTYRVIKPLPEVARLVGLLAEFAFYAGVGWQTTHGLGQVRPELPAS